MKDKTFSFNINSKIIIYGCSGNGIYYYRKLKEKGYKVEAFIDMRADEMGNAILIDECSVPVYQLRELKDIKKSNIIIFIAIRNSIEQNNIAKLLYKDGYENVIFIPMLKENINNKNNINILRQFYRDFIEGIFKDNKSLPKLNCLFQNKLFQDYALIKRNTTHVIAWAPISIVFYYSLKQKMRMIESFGISHAKNTDEIYLDKSIFQVEYINQLFDFFLLGEKNLDTYFDFENKISNSVKNKSSVKNQLWLEDRQKCVEIMERGTNRGEDYWVESAIPVEWNSKGFFNICDGAHRLAYLNAMNMHMVPIQTTIDDYNKWINPSVNEEVIEMLKRNDIKEFEAPIVHPWYYECNSREEKVGVLIIKLLLKHLGAKGIKKNYSVLDVEPHEGYYLQHFARLGAQTTGIVKNEKERELLWNFNKLFYLDEKILILLEKELQKQKGKHNIVFLMKKLSQFEDEEECIEYLHWINSIISETIVWESGIDYEKEKKLILDHTDFKKYHFFKRILSDKIIREVGIFTKV